MALRHEKELIKKNFGIRCKVMLNLSSVNRIYLYLCLDQIFIFVSIKSLFLSRSDLYIFLSRLDLYEWNGRNL